jgi:CubicO group peptidase (beta-lactamase class C family)
MQLRRCLHLFLLLSLSLAQVSVVIGTPKIKVGAKLRVQGETKPAAKASPTADLAARLASIEKAVEDSRKESHVPGLSLVVVKDDKVIYVKGFGLKDVEHNAAVTPGTLFAIGSCTKAFTAMAAVMSVDDGKLSLDDSPKKFLPYFKLRDPDADARVTLRDLLSHRTGLGGTDLAWLPGKLTREEVIRVAGLAKSTAKLGEKFQYQNVMFSAAGETVAAAQHTTWEDLISTRILNPLGMSATRLSISEMQKSPDFSVGYDYNTATKQTRSTPMRDLISIAPAGAINSNADDMARWLRFMLSGGVFQGKRLISEKNFAALLTKQVNIAGTIDYGLGWGLTDWKGHKLASHSGGIDGFGALVEFMPDKKIGYALLANVEDSPIGAAVRSIVWTNLIEEPPGSAGASASAGPVPAVSVADMQRETGTYNFPEAKFDVDISLKDGKLLMTVPGQPQYALENIGGRRYKLSSPAPPGFFATFRPAKSNETETEMYLEQPQGNYLLHKAKPGGPSTAQGAGTGYSGPLADLLGSYEMKQVGVKIDITVKDGQVVVIVPGQRPYPLAEKEKDHLYSPSLSDAYSAVVKRDAAGRV